MRTHLEAAVAQGLINKEKVSALVEDLEKRESMPWYLHVVLFTAAWFATSFFISFLAAFDILEHQTVSLTIGVIVLCSGAFLDRQQIHAFTDHLGVSLGVTGHLLTTVSLTMLILGEDNLFKGDGWALMAAIATVIAVLFYVFLKGKLFRFIISGIAIWLIAIWGWDDQTMTWFVVTQLAGLVFLLRQMTGDPRFRPLLHALAISLPCTMVAFGSIGMAAPPRLVLSAFITVAIFLLLVQERKSSELSEPLLIGALVAVGAGLITSPGVLVALFLVLAGYARGEHHLWLIGLISFAAYLFFYYYDLDLDLATKSYLLMGSGSFILLLRGFLIKRKQAVMS